MGGYRLVGRERELGVLVEAAGGAPALVLVEGQAGVGKSMLVGELLKAEALKRRRVLVGGCHRLREPFPLGSVVEALRGLARQPPLGALDPVVGVLRGLLPELASRLPPAPESLSDPRAERHRCFRAILELLGALGPSVLVLEDLHWADEATLELLGWMLRQPPRELSLVLTYRRDGLARGSPLLGLAACARAPVRSSSIVLSALRSVEVRELIEGLLGAEAVSEELASVVYERTAGNPLAVEQLVGLLAERGELVFREGGWTAGAAARAVLPPALCDMVLQRVGLLSADAGVTMQAVAVLEPEAHERLIAKVSALTPARGRRALCEALATGLLVECPERRYRFCHPLAADAVYDAIPGPARSELHLRSARALERSPDPRPLARIAHHFKQAGNARQWLRYAELAADALAALGEDRDAAQLLQQALATPNLSPTAQARIAIKLGHAALYGRVPNPAIAILRGILEADAIAPGLRGEVRLAGAWLLFIAGECQLASSEMRLAAGDLEHRPLLAARVMTDLATYPTSDRDRDERMRWIDRASAAVRTEADPVVSIRVAATRAEVLVASGDPTGWRALAQISWQATGAGQQLELVRAGKRLAQAALLLGHHDRAGSLLDGAEDLRVQLRNARFRVGIATIRNLLLWRTGQWQQLHDNATRLVYACADVPGMWASNQLVISWLALVRGDIGEAERGFGEVLRTAGIAGFSDGLIAAAAGALTRIQLARNNNAAACKLAGLGIESLRRGSWVRAYSAAPSCVDALLACNRAVEADELTRELARGLRGRDAPAAVAALDLCRAALSEARGRHSQAARRFAAAERRWRRLPWPYEAARARERRGRVLLAHGDRSGIDALLGALQDFHDLGATWDEGRLRAALRSYNVRLPPGPRRGRRGYGPELSPREHQVARLAALGKSNREIAEALVISPYTVAHHVSAILRKLEIPSRRSLAALGQPK